MKLFVASAALVAALLSATASAAPIRIGVLPAADSVVLHVAAEEGLFAKEGLEVELVPFRSALEVGAAMRAGRLEGHFGDVMNVLLQNATGAAQKIVLTTTHTHPEQRAFALLVSPKAKIDVAALKNLPAGTPTAMSSATIIDYLLERMHETEGLPDGALKNLEVKQIPIRLQMLLSGKVETALLPEPLVSVVEAKGGRVLWDDRKLDEALAVVALKTASIDEKTVSGLRSAVAEAARLIEASPEKYRAVMVKKGLLPAAVAPDYKMVRFSIYGTKDGLPPLPSAHEVRRVGDWMVKRGMLKTVPEPSEVVLPAGDGA